MKKAIRFNENNFQNEVQHIELGCKKLNELRLLVEEFTGTPTMAKQTFELIEDPLEILRVQVNKLTPETLRNANFDFKLEALGLTNSFRKVVDFVAENHGAWVGYQYEFEKGIFVFKGYEDVKEKHTIFAETETEITKLEFFIKLKNLLNDGFEIGYLNINSRPDTVRYIKELEIDVPTGENNYKVVVNPYAIKDVE